MYRQFCPQDWRVESMINPKGMKPSDEDWTDSQLTSKYAGPRTMHYTLY
jgi:hypothetical protein